MPQAPQWEDSEAAPSWDDSEETPSWDQSTTIEVPELPRRFLSPDKPIPDVGGGLPPRMTEADLAQAEKQSKLGEEIAGTMAEAQIVGNAERAITLAEEGIVSPKVAEMAMAVGAPALNTLPGVRRALAEAGSGLTSPVNLGMMLGAGGASAIPKIGGAVARGIAGGFAADMATHMPELGTAAGEASVTGTPEEQQKAFTDIGVSALMGGLAGAGAVARARPAIPPRIVEAIAKGDAAGLTKATQAVADAVREQPKQEVISAEAIRSDPGLVKPETQVLESSPDRVDTTAKLFGDEGSLTGLQEVGFDNLSVQTKKTMAERVRTALHDDQIFRQIVESIPIDVVNSLTGKQFSLKQLLSDKAVLLDKLAGDVSNLPVGHPVSRFIDSVASTPEIVGTPAGAKGGSAVATPANLTGLPTERSTAKGTPEKHPATTLQQATPVKENPTGPEVIKSIIELPDAEAGALRQKPAVEAGMKLTEADVPALEAARAKTMKEATDAAEAGNNDAFKASFGKNIWFSGAIEGARRKGPNYDTFIKEQGIVPEKAQSVSERPATVSQTEPIVSQTTAPTPPEAQPIGSASRSDLGQPAVGAAEVPAKVNAPDWDLFYEDLVGNMDSFSPARSTGKRSYVLDDLAQRFVDYAKADITGRSPPELVKDFAKQDEASAGQIRKLKTAVTDMAPPVAASRSQPLFERESEVGKTVEVGPGMGGAKASEPVDPRAQLAQLTDSIATLAKEGKSAPAKAFDLGRALSHAKESVTSTLDGLKAAGQYMKLRLEGKPVATEYRGVLGDRHLALSESSVNARKWMQNVKKAVPDPQVREAISDWVDTGGDPALLTKAASETKSQYKAGYERAKKLTPEEKVVAENLKNYFDSRLQEAIDAGVLEDGIENYIHRAYEAESPWKKGVIQELRSGLFTGQPALAKKRVFEYDFEAEKLGKKPVKDFSQRVAAYDLALNKSIADRAAVKAMMEIKMSDGRPMIDVGGGGKIIENAAGEAQATLINRSAKKIDPNDPKADRGDFKPFDHPALRKWKWATEDSAGKPIFVQGDVLIHPEAIGDIRKLLEPSAIRRNPVGRAALGVSSTIKQTMLDLSGFHPVQIAVHGTEHRTFAPVKEIDFTNPDVRGLIRGGAAVGETSGHAAFSEGVSGAGSSLTKHIPWAGERLQAYNSWLFEDYIPRLKVAMGLHALERNRGRYKDLSSDQLYQLTADQMNAAFGEQNYTMLGRSKTTQDTLRLALLAPDFLEARGRFAAQAFTKYGTEQRQALILGAVTMYITARMLNKMMTDEYHFEPKNAFNLVVGGKSYGLRTVQGDLVHAVTEPGKFINHRLNPVYGKPALEFVTGRDYFGRKREGVDKLKDFAMTPIPIGLRGALDNQEQTLLDTFLNSFGLVTKRDSPSSDMAELAKEWKKDNDIKTGPGEFIYDAEQDPYRPIKLAAERDDEAGARSEIAKAINDGMKRSQIIQHFKLSEKHRFAGSAANERKFLESLTEDQKKIYQDAKTERRRIRELVMRALP